jgi:hypothetical protein
MWDVGCGMWDVGCGRRETGDGRRETGDAKKRVILSRRRGIAIVTIEGLALGRDDCDPSLRSG